MNLKKIIIAGMVGATVLSMGMNGEAAKKASATPTMTQSVTVPQMRMDLDGNTNYLLVWNRMGTRFYIDLSSIVVKQNDDKMRWWAQNIIEVNEEGKYLGQSTQEFCCDRTMDHDFTRQWNPDNRTWEVLNPYETNSRYQNDARAYNLGYIFAFQGGNPVEK